MGRKGDAKSSWGQSAGTSSGQGATKGLGKLVTRCSPPRWKSREGMRQDRFCQRLKRRTSILMPFHDIWPTAASKAMPGAFDTQCESSEAKQSCRSYVSWRSYPTSKCQVVGWTWTRVGADGTPKLGLYWEEKLRDREGRLHSAGKVRRAGQGWTFPKEASICPRCLETTR